MKYVSWLRALRNTYVSGLRGKGNRAQSIPLEDASTQLVAGPETSPVAMTEAREVFALIASLPDDYRDVVVAVDVVGLSYAEAATAFERYLAKRPDAQNKKEIEDEIDYLKKKDD